MWEITKEFNFEYGHRVWSQTLNPKFSLGVQCACRHPHGHSGKVLITLQGDKLNDQGMVTDFKHLGWFKQFLDDNLDHKFLLDKHDPIFGKLFAEWADLNMIFSPHSEGFKTIFPEVLVGKEDAVKEWFEGFVILPFIPTSENIAAWLHGIVDAKMKTIGIKTKRVQLFETVKSQSVYTGD